MPKPRPKPLATSRLVTLRAAVEEYGISEWRFRRYIGDGHLPAFVPPGERRHILLERADIEAMLARWKERGVPEDVLYARDDRGRFRGRSGDSDSESTESREESGRIDRAADAESGAFGGNH